MLGDPCAVIGDEEQEVFRWRVLIGVSKFRRAQGGGGGGTKSYTGGGSRRSGSRYIEGERGCRGAGADFRRLAIRTVCGSRSKRRFFLVAPLGHGGGEASANRESGITR